MREGGGDRRHHAAGEPFGAGEEVEQDVLRGQRRDGEVEALQPRGRQAEDEPDQRRWQAPASGIAKNTGTGRFVAEIGRGERAEAEERRVADRDLPGEADQDVQAERGDADDSRSGSAC